MKKKAFVTGISGQDGSYLAELLLEKDYEVYGIVRRHSHAQGQNIRFAHIKDNLNVDYGDLLDQSSLYRTLASVKPDEIYNLAAQSHVRVSYDVPQYTMQTNVVGTLNLLLGIAARMQNFTKLALQKCSEIALMRMASKGRRLP